MSPTMEQTPLLVRCAGRLMIGAVWLVAAYLLGFHTVVTVIGPNALHDWLGEATYNRWVPTGGIHLALGVAFGIVLYAVPLLFLALIARGVAWLTPQPVRKRWFMGLCLGMVVAAGGLHWFRSPGSFVDMLWHALGGTRSRGPVLGVRLSRATSRNE